MVDEEPLADSGSGMNFNACQEATEVRKKTSQELEPVLPKKVGDAVEPQGMESRIAEDNIQRAPRRWVFGENRFNIFS
jgi:hypothetical protein